MLTVLVGQTFMLVVMGLLLFALISVITNKKVQTLVKYMFKSAMRAITGVFVEIDPIGIMRNYIDELREKRDTMATSRDKLRGQLVVLDRQISANTQEHDKSMATAQHAHQKGNTAVFSVHSRQAGRLEKLNKESLVPLRAQIDLHLKALNKYYEVTGTVIDDLTNEVKAREIERKMILESHSAMRAAKAILNGGTDAKELFDQAMEFVVEDFGMKMGEIDSFIENSKGFVEGLDMQNGVYEVEALKKLQAWEAKADSILLGTSGKQQLLEQTTATPLPQNIGSTVDYSEFITRR